jgi:predicted CxxxxCH...CXXCH cytochrome family protein
MQTAGSATHLKHTAKYACSVCHNAAGSGTNKHADSYIDVSFSGAGVGASYSQTRTLAGSDGFGTCSTVSCHFNKTAQWGTVLTCEGCHPMVTLLASGAHAKHVSTAPVYYAYTSNRTTTSLYDFGCSNCHPLEQANHANGTLDVTINKINAGSGGAVGYLRSKNGASADGLSPAEGPSGVFGVSKTSVRCATAYCHSNGYAANLKYAVSPDWYGPAYTGDKCAMCHGNSPNANDPVNQPGSPAHYSKNFLGFANISGGHVFGIHTNNILKGSAGLASVGNTPTGTHGNAGTSTTINCNMCHYSTVTTFANDYNKVCAGCHLTAPKNPAELIANKRIHLSGKVEVALNPVKVRSKAQLRDGSFNQAIWSRPAGYKVPGAYDVAFKTMSTVTQWDGTTGTCSNIACHNGKTVRWSDTGGTTSCISCHDTL